MKQKLTLYPDTFLWRKGDEGLLYHAKGGNMLRFEATGKVNDLCARLEQTDNLYSLLFDPEQLDVESRKFIEAIELEKFGCVSSADTMLISLPPLLNIQRDVRRLSKDKDRGIGENVLDYLSALTIYLGGQRKVKPYFRQIIYPVYSKSKLSVNRIAEFLDTMQVSALQTINLVVSDISDPEIAHNKDILINYKEQIVINYLHDDLKDKNVVPYMLANDGFKVRFICESPVGMLRRKTLKRCIAEEQNMGFLFGYDFIVRNDREYKFWNELVENLSLIDYAMIPVFEDNGAFFDQNVFINEKDLAETHLCRREVFAHQAINTNAFGKLYVMPNGTVYSDVTAPALGTIKDSIYILIERELHENHAWRRIRNTEKCQKCIYQWLCPSPTAYETEAGRETVCTFR